VRNVAGNLPDRTEPENESSGKRLGIWQSSWHYIYRTLRGRAASKGAAHERLQLVLVHDRSGLSAENLTELKNDLALVISKYLAIERDSLDIVVKRSGDSIALVTNIQVKSRSRAKRQRSLAKGITTRTRKASPKKQTS
jgi:cell division topological specificity factor